MGQFDSLRALDLFPKISDEALDAGIVHRTKAGAWVSVSTLFMLVYIFVAQTAEYWSPQTVTQYKVAMNQAQYIGIHFGVNFTQTPCSALSVDYANIYGSFKINATQGRLVDTSSGKSSFRVRMKKFNKDLHVNVSSGSFFKTYPAVADDKWACSSSGKLTDPDGILPCIGQEAYTYITFISELCSLCEKFVKDFDNKVQDAFDPFNSQALPNGTTVPTTTTYNHHNTVPHIVLSVDCDDEAMKPICMAHSIHAVPTVYTYRAGKLLSSAFIRLPVDNMEKVIEKLSEDQTSLPASRCLGWRQTGQCSPLGLREPWKDRSCASIVPNGASGYCECIGNIKANMLTCNHGQTKNGGFTCEEICLSATGGQAGFGVSISDSQLRSHHLSLTKR